MVYLLVVLSVSLLVLLRHLRYQKVSRKLHNNFSQKLGSLSLGQENLKRNRLTKEFIAETGLFIGNAGYNFLALSHLENLATNATEQLGVASELVKENAVFKALERRYPELETDEVISKFRDHLDGNMTLLKGDVGEQVGAGIRATQGVEVHFPAGLDGTWKSNQIKVAMTTSLKMGIILTWKIPK